MKKTLLFVAVLVLCAVGVSFAAQFKHCDRYQWMHKRDAAFEGRAGYYAYLYDLEDTTTIADSTQVDSLSYFCFDITHAGEYWIKVEGRWYDKIAVSSDSISGGTIYIDTLAAVNLFTLGSSSIDHGAILMTVQNKSGGTMHVGHPATAFTDTVELDDYLAATAATVTCDDDLSDSCGYYWIAVLGTGTIAATDSIILWGESTEGAADADTFALTASTGTIALSTLPFTTIDSFTVVNTLAGDSLRIYGIPYMMVTDAAANENEFMGITYPDSIASDSTGTVAVFGIALAKVDATTTDMILPGELLLCKGSNMLDETTVDSLAVAIALQAGDSSDDSVKVFIYKMGK